MKNHTCRTLSMNHVITLGFLLGLVACSSTPLRPQPFQSHPPTAVEVLERQEQRGVESQLLKTQAEARNLGTANPLLLSTMYSLASFYREHHEFDKAEAIYREAISLKEQVYGPDHQDIALILNQYAALLRDARRVQEATALEHRARQIQASQSQHTISRP